VWAMRERHRSPEELPPKPTAAMLNAMTRPMLSVSAALTLGRSSNLFPRWMNVQIEAEHDVPANRLVLMWLLSQIGELRMGVIAQMLDLTPRAITRQVDGLERDGLAERRTSESDGRVFHVRLTDKGSELISKLEPELVESFSSLFACLDKAEMREMIRILEKLTDHMMAQIEIPRV
ncbi:MAG: MarR family transcriptional regulator, partial [Actinomycetes bacterium]